MRSNVGTEVKISRLYHRNWLKRIFHQPKYFIRLVEGHHYINRLVDVFESTTFIFLVFELCQNIDLFDYLSEHVSLSEKRCRAIMKQIFEAVYHCHKVISKDMKKESSLKKVNLNISESYYWCLQHSLSLPWLANQSRIFFQNKVPRCRFRLANIYDL